MKVKIVRERAYGWCESHETARCKTDRKTH
jgi:hypothetical protein